MMSRLLRLAARAALVTTAVAVLGGCAAMNRLDSDVSTYSQWPPGRKPASYVFERLPSQQSRAEAQEELESAARQAVEQAGFTLSADVSSADFSVQLAARSTASERWPYDDPFWYPGGGLFYGWHGRGGGFYGPWAGWYGPGWYGRFPTTRFEREVAVLIRDRRSGQVLYEARAVNDALTPSFDGLLPAMFTAAMRDFPNPGINPRRVTIELSPAP